MDFRDKKTQRILLFGIGAAAILYLYFFSTFLPFSHRAVAAERSELEADYRQLSSDLSKARQTLNNLAEVERQYQILNKRWDVASQLLPEDKEVAELLRKVTLVGQQAGVEFLLFKPKPQVSGDIYNENPVDVKVAGGYHQVGAFLAEVANLERIVNVSNLSLVTNPDDKAPNDQTVEAHFMATAYTLNPNPPAPAPQASDKSAETAGKGEKKHVG